MATATATAPQARAQSTSCGVSPITTRSAGGNSRPSRACARRAASDAKRGVKPARRQMATVHVIRAVGPHPEARPEAGRQELDAGPLLDIAGHQAQHRRRGSGELLHHGGDAGEGDHPPPVADLGDQPADVRLEEVVEPLVHSRRLPAFRAHDVVHDAGVGAPAEIVGVDPARRPEDPLEGRSHRATPGPPRGDQGAVDVEQDELHARIGRAARCAAERRARAGAPRWAAGAPAPRPRRPRCSSDRG